MLTRSLAFLALLGLASAPADLVTINPAEDTCLFELQPDFNFGGQEDFPSGTLGSAGSNARSRLLMRFDLAGALPSNAVIEAASLRLSVTRAPDGGGANSTFALHRMLKSWGEGAKHGSAPGGAKATAGEATWNARFFPDQLWAAPGGAPGEDYAAQSSSSERILGPGVYEFEFGANQLAEITDWLRQPESNFGWMLRSQSEEIPRSARRFGASDHSNPSIRPALTLQFSVPAAIDAPRITGISLTPEGVIAIRFSAEAGLHYRLESTPILPTESWQTASEPAQASANGELTLEDPTPGAPSKFYRVAAFE